MTNREQHERANNLIRKLKGTECICGKPKAGGRTFCGACYFTLPRQMQKELYRRVGKGYEEAYDRAIEFLSETLVKG